MSGWLPRPGFWFLTVVVHTPFSVRGGTTVQNLALQTSPGKKQGALTFIEVAEKRTLIVPKVGFEVTSPRMCLASQWLIWYKEQPCLRNGITYPTDALGSGKR